MTVYYLLLDSEIGLALAVLVAPILAMAEIVARQSLAVSIGVVLIFFAGGWVIQLIGHHIEGNRPALLDNLFHALVAPAFLVAELLFALGLRRDLREEIERRMAGDGSRRAGGGFWRNSPVQSRERIG